MVDYSKNIPKSLINLRKSTVHNEAQLCNKYFLWHFNNADSIIQLAKDQHFKKPYTTESSIKTIGQFTELVPK